MKPDKSIVVVAGEPIDKLIRICKYPLFSMSVGESFFAKRSRGSMTSLLGYYRKTNKEFEKMKFVCRTQPRGGVKVWRVK